MLSKYPWFFVGGRGLGSDKGKISFFLNQYTRSILTPQTWLFWVYLPPRNIGSNPLPLEGSKSLGKLMVLSLSWSMFCKVFLFCSQCFEGDLWMFETWASPYIFVWGFSGLLNDEHLVFFDYIDTTVNTLQEYGNLHVQMWIQCMFMCKCWCLYVQHVKAFCLNLSIYLSIMCVNMKISMTVFRHIQYEASRNAIFKSTYLY